MPGFRADLARAISLIVLTTTPVAIAAEAGDPRAGEALFTGARALRAGGAPCLACHGIAGHGLARAASFGPDLTGVAAGYGADALDATLADVPFPSMQPLYAARGLTPEERAHLVAFLSSAAGDPPRLDARFALGTAGIAALFLLGFVAVGRRRGTHRSTP